MVVISGKDGKTYHEPFCPYARRIKKFKKEIKVGEAIKKGYRPCKFCCGVRGKVYQYRSLYGSKCGYDKVDNAISFRTDVGLWKIMFNERWEDWHLYHMNHYGYHCFNPDLPTKLLLRGKFHRQKDVPYTKDLDKIFKYIISHDRNYKNIESNYKKLPKSTKQQRKYRKQAKRRQKRNKIRLVNHLINKLNKN